MVVGLFQVLATNNYANAVDARHYCHYVDVLPIMSSSLSSTLIEHKQRVANIVINFNGAKLAGLPCDGLISESYKVRNIGEDICMCIVCIV